MVDVETQLQYANPTTRVRGLTSADVAEDFFLTNSRVDSYNVDQVEINRGPNAMLYGLGSPGGIINSDLKEADVERNKGSLVANFGEYGSIRSALDYNQVLIKDKLALRVDTLHDKEYYRIQPTYSQDNRIYLAGTYKPFKNTTIQSNMEIGRDNYNRPEDRPPFDGFSMWWAEGKPIFNPVTRAITQLGTASGIYATMPVSHFMTNTGLGGNSYMPSLIYSNPQSSVPGIPGQNFVAMEGGEDGTGEEGLSSYDRLNNLYIHANDDTHGFWRVPQLTNPDIYDFYHYQLDGSNNYQWAQWENYNIYLNQTFLDNHAGFRLAYDHQEMDEGSVQMSTYDNMQLRIDVDPVLPNGAPNPNFGRMLEGSSGYISVDGIHAENLQATAYGLIDARDYLHNWLGQLIGTHVFTGAYTRQDTTEDYGHGAAFDMGLPYDAALFGAGDVEDVGSQTREVGLTHYVGPSVLNAAGPGQVHAGNYVGQFPSGVSSIAVLANPSVTNGGVADTSPAGWQVANYPLEGAGHYDVDGVGRAGYASRARTEVNSAVIIGQNRWFDGNIVTTEGIRRDTVWSYDAGSNPDGPTGVAVTDWNVWYPKLTSEMTQDSKDWGIVAHSPAFINRYLPWGSTISLSYSYSDNFSATAQRYNMYGDPLGPEIGQTKDYGVHLTLFHGKVDLKVGRYRTADALNSSSLGSLNGYINQIPLVIGNVFDENALPNNGLNQGNTAGLAAWNAWVQTPGAQQFLKTFRFTNIDTTKTDWNPPQISATTDLVSTGWEFEGVVNPTPHWRIGINVEEAEAVRSNTGKDVQDILNNVFLPMLNGPAGTLEDADYHNPISETFQGNVIIPISTIVRQDGAPTSELARWHYNLVTNYAFTKGILKNWNVSGAVRYIDGQSIGFPVLPVTATTGVADVKHPYMSSSQMYYDASVGYTVPHLYKNVSWHVQLYLHNIGVGDRLIPINANPDGSIDAWMIDEPMTWTLANTFDF
ncbi:MAG: hypothetical protein ACREFX_06530 [Opitutaceae bacterium]